MTRIALATLPEKGHYHPFLGPAAVLEERGAEVVFIVPADVRTELAAAGFPGAVVAGGATAAGPPESGNRGAAFAALLKDRARLRAWIRSLLVDGQAAAVPPLAAVLRALRPDAVALDPMWYAAAIACERERIPWVGWSTSLNPVVSDAAESELIATLRDLDPARRELFRSFGQDARFRVSDVLAPRGTAVFATEELTGPAPPGVRLVGPSLPRRPRARAAPPIDAASLGPFLYASFGSQAWWQPRRFETLFAAGERAGLAVVAAAGDLARDLAPAPPSQAVAAADQLALLWSARAFATHGGANSVMEALAFGVPLLVSPICNDQPHNATLVCAAGAGIELDLDAASADEVANVLARLAGDGPEREAAGRLCRAYARRDGAAGAAELALAACR